MTDQAAATINVGGVVYHTAKSPNDAYSLSKRYQAALQRGDAYSMTAIQAKLAGLKVAVEPN